MKSRIERQLTNQRKSATLESRSRNRLQNLPHIPAYLQTQYHRRETRHLAQD